MLTLGRPSYLLQQVNPRGGGGGGGGGGRVKKHEKRENGRVTGPFLARFSTKVSKKWLLFSGRFHSEKKDPNG